MTLDRSNAGLLGYHALLAKYGEKQVNKWRRMGGRKRHRTLAEIQAETRDSRSTTRRRSADH